MQTQTERPQKPKITIDEVGAPVNDHPQIAKTRLFCQFQAFGNCQDPQAVKAALEASKISSVLYLDVNDPYGIGLATFAENPETFTTTVRDLFNTSPFTNLSLKPEFTMFGRTYASGREPNLEDWLLKKPLRSALNPDFPWAVWYPLRRKPEFESLPREEQGKIMMEHSLIGRAYAEEGFAQDIRLACHGLDKNDNDFVIGITSPQLHILSKLVQNMRKTQQTSKYLTSLGPFFVGKVSYQSPFEIH